MNLLIKPILIGALFYIPLYAILWGLFQLPDSWFTNDWVQLLLTPFNLVMLPACGYVAARLAKQKGLYVGAMSGVIIALATVATSASLMGESWYENSLVVIALGFIMKYAFYCALGGGVRELHSQKGWVA